MEAQCETTLDEKTIEKFKEILFGEAEQKTQIASCLIDFISDKNEQTQIELIAYLLQNFGIPGLESGVKLGGRKMHGERYLTLAETLDEMIHGTIKLIIHSRKQPKDAAKMLRDLIFSFDDIEQRDYCLAEIMSDDAVPYRQPIPQSAIQSYSNLRLRQIAADNIDPLAQIRAVLRTEMDTTVQAELILKILSSVEDFQNRVGVFELGIIQYFLKKIKDIKDARS